MTSQFLIATLISMVKLPSQPGYQSGQALLLIVLSLAVVLTIVLSILARSVTDIKISTGSDEALRAFSAAEAGIERALIAGGSIGTTQIGEATFSASVTEIGEGAKSFTNPSQIFSGETSSFWFVSHDEDGNLICDFANNCFTGDTVKICWGKEGTSDSSSTTPAVEASLVYAQTPGDYSTLMVAREAVDPNSSRRATNNFSAPDSGSCSLGEDTFAFQKTLDLGALGIAPAVSSSPNGLQFATVRMLYNVGESHGVGLSVDFPSNGILPGQGVAIESSGISGEANRKISVFQGYSEPPLPFGVTVFSPTGVVK